MTPRILIVEDEGVLAQSIQRSLEREGHEVAVEKSAEAGLDAIASFDADLVLLDLLLPGMSGLEFLRTIREQGHEMPVIAMSAHGAVRSAVEAMRLGSYDYVTKPLDLQELKILIARALDHARLSRELTYLREREAPLQLLLGDCPEMREVRGQIERIARMERQSGAGAPPVLILGETGTGKGLAARSIHRASSRSASPFVDVHCGALGEAELFGWDKGAFADAPAARRGLLEAADHGTLFLDEIGHLSRSTQTKLLQVIEDQTFRRPGFTRDRRVDVRIIAATNRDLRAAGSTDFLPELLQRLEVLDDRPAAAPGARGRRGPARRDLRPPPRRAVRPAPEAAVGRRPRDPAALSVARQCPRADQRDGAQRAAGSDERAHPRASPGLRGAAVAPRRRESRTPGRDRRPAGGGHGLRAHRARRHRPSPRADGRQRHTGGSISPHVA